MDALNTPPSPTHRTVLLQPGIHGSGPAHWQSIWETRHGGVRRIQQQDWDHPVCADWVRGIESAVAACAQPPVLVAHSLGCLAAVHWQAAHGQAVREQMAHGQTATAQRLHALILVAVPDPAGPRFPRDARGFGPAPLQLGGVDTTVVSSDDDPYADPAHLARLVGAWGARHVRLGRLGHINADSGLGDWAFGWGLVQQAGGGAPFATPT